jgi:hypothetical protein
LRQLAFEASRSQSLAQIAQFHGCTIVPIGRVANPVWMH